MPTDTITQFKFESASASLGMLTTLLEQSNDCIKVMGTDGSLDYMNRNGQRIMAIDDFAQISGKLWWELWPEESQAIVKGAVAKARRGEASAFEAFCPTAKGDARWWDVSVSPLRDENGTVISIISISRDVSAHIQARLATETLAQEMGHRVRNAYTLSSALARTLARGDETLEHFADHFGERLMHLGTAQNLVMDSGAASGTDLATLVNRLTSVYRGKEGSIEVLALPEAPLTEKQAQALALAIGELATNSYKYGALGTGRTVTVSSCDRDGKSILCWNEPTTRDTPSMESEDLAHHGGGQHSGGQHSGGQGKMLVKRFMTAVGGEIDFDWRPGELAVSITLPPRT